ncbi:MAG: hypothetical protein FJX19_12170 [Alphaproteobacteria bacterium]|nr:hypothetical protein [Alphaproteobacteria bacterium]
MARTDENDDAPTLPRGVRLLQGLVVVLTLSMIGGIVTVVAVIVTRFPAPPTPALPETLALPDGARVIALTQGRDWYAVVIEGDAILIFDRTTGALRQRVEIAPP